MEIYLIRHTAPLIEQGICYGQSDIPLAGTFESEKKLLLTNLPQQLDAVYSSPLSRCLQFAQCLVSAPSVITDNRLLEMNFGDWELKKWNDLEEGLLNAWMNDFVETRVPNGENFIALYTRIQDFIHELIEKEYMKIAIVTHAGVIRCFIAYLLDLALTNAFKIQLAYSSITKIHLQKDGCMNSIEYLNKV